MIDTAAPIGIAAAIATVIEIEMRGAMVGETAVRAARTAPIRAIAARKPVHSRNEAPRAARRRRAVNQRRAAMHGRAARYRAAEGSRASAASARQPIAPQAIDPGNAAVEVDGDAAAAGATAVRARATVRPRTRRDRSMRAGEISRSPHRQARARRRPRGRHRRPPPPPLTRDPLTGCRPLRPLARRNHSHRAARRHARRRLPHRDRSRPRRLRAGAITSTWCGHPHRAKSRAAVRMIDR